MKKENRAFTYLLFPQCLANDVIKAFVDDVNDVVLTFYAVGSAHT